MRDGNKMREKQEINDMMDQREKNVNNIKRNEKGELGQEFYFDRIKRKNGKE